MQIAHGEIELDCESGMSFEVGLRLASLSGRGQCG